ncbi:MAG: DEAD/DEAH box helicase [Candidatus Gastranaerophilales bacterium]|nr:DEAD/DEAH box helicase [Candidatus Gastranaerophilales bacterium]
MDKKYNLSFKKNDIEKLLLNLDQNPYSQKNKDFRYTLSLIYELIEEEFADTFDTKNPILRQTKISLKEEANAVNIFITPPYNFDYYLKQKGSLYRLRPQYQGQDYGYSISLDMFFEYFTGVDESLDLSDCSEDYQFYFNLFQFVKKTVEKLQFIPAVNFKKDTFSIYYEPYFQNKDYIRAYCEIVENDVLSKEVTQKLIEKYLNYLIFTFLNVKHYRFKDLKAAPYLVKNALQKRIFKGNDLASDIQTWFDEMSLGSYELVPVFNIEKLDDEKFLLKILAKNKAENKIIQLEDLTDEEKVIIEKQINWATKYIEDLEDVEMELDLSGVYKLITQISYYLSQAGMEVNLPEGLNDVIIPRASINATIKEKRLSELKELLANPTGSTISLDEIMNFKIEIALGNNEKISAEEFRELAKNSQGLIKYKEKYILIDKEETDKLLQKLEKTPNFAVNKMQLLHNALSGKIDDYDFDYDEAFARVISDFTKVEDITLPKDLCGTLRAYQEIGFRWLYTNINKGFGCCIADDMGLGKTIQVISLILKLKEENKLKKPVLVVCPTTLMGNWKRELNTFAPSLNVLTYHGFNREFSLDCDVILTTYAILRIDLEKFEKTQWDLLIIDEAQNIKNPSTSQTQAIKAIKAGMKVAMTGTPVENRLSELWSIFDFINKGYLGSLTDFSKNYSIPIERFKELNRAQKLKKAISPFMLRRLKTDKTIISDLPEKVVLDDFCYLTKSQVALYERILKQSMEDITKSESKMNRRGAIFKLITNLKQVCNHPYHYLKHGDMSANASGKTQKLIDILHNIVENDEKVLVFTQYKEMGTILENIIAQEFNQSPLFFHGSLNVKQREDIIHKFQEDLAEKIMILSLKAGGLGLNLTSASNVIHYDLWWNPAVEDQATDRTYRIGQDKNVMIHRFITLSTFEEKIDKIIKDKRELANAAVFEGERTITELSDDELYEIFSLA